MAILGSSMQVQAITSSEMQQQINKHQQQLSGIQGKIEDLEEQQDLLEEIISDLNAEIINTMTSIGLKEDEIIEKEMGLMTKEEQIGKTEEAYWEAKAKEEQQQEDMITRAQRMYETGNTNYLSNFLLGAGLGGLLNRMDYMEEVYEYDRRKLLEFENTKIEVHDLWDRLEEEKLQLQSERDQLQADKAVLDEQKKSLDQMMDRKKKESANFDAEIKQAKQEASVQKKLIQQEKTKLKKLKEEEAKAAAAGSKTNTTAGNSAALSGNYATTSCTDTINAASGSEKGKNIAKYACQFIGNPYVSGGTSLTNGADCSGFTYRVYADFGISLPRTSFEQRSAGTGVEYANAQPGDLICYSGHVAMYIGGGRIVHASTRKTGIKTGNANYRPILAVRRIVK